MHNVHLGTHPPFYLDPDGFWIHDYLFTKRNKVDVGKLHSY